MKRKVIFCIIFTCGSLQFIVSQKIYAYRKSEGTYAHEEKKDEFENFDLLAEQMEESDFTPSVQRSQEPSMIDTFLQNTGIGVYVKKFGLGLLLRYVAIRAYVGSKLKDFRRYIRGESETQKPISK